MKSVKQNPHDLVGPRICAQPGITTVFLVSLMMALMWAGPVAATTTGEAVASASRQTIRVGPGRRFTRPSQAARVAGNGALIEIDAGDYHRDVAVWKQHDLTLRGVGGRARLHADGHSAQGKAIWVLRGDRITVENLEFSGARVRSHNGAGIRAEGAGLTLRNCRFHHNEMGLLTHRSKTSVVVIEDSEFDHNRSDTERHGKLGHNLYINRIARFELHNSHIHGARHGHQVKTRARHNIIRGNRIVDGDGASSYLLDIAEGGRAEVIGNHFEQSAGAENRTAISFAPERNRRRSGQALYVSNNTFINHGGSATFVRNFSTTPVWLRGNVIKGRGVKALRGLGTVD